MTSQNIKAGLCIATVRKLKPAISQASCKPCLGLIAVRHRCSGLVASSSGRGRNLPPKSGARTVHKDVDKNFVCGFYLTLTLTLSFVTLPQPTRSTQPGHPFVSRRNQEINRSVNHKTDHLHKESPVVYNN